jgi:hypothetical protein
MSSFTRTIQRTLTRKMLKHRKGRHFMGRGQRLGTVNPKDPCRTGKRKTPKVWRDSKNAPPAKAAIKVAAMAPVVDRQARKAAHQFKMLEKSRRADHFHQTGNSPARVARLLGNPATINRHTGEPHKHLRASQRRAERSAVE